MLALFWLIPCVPSKVSVMQFYHYSCVSNLKHIQYYYLEMLLNICAYLNNERVRIGDLVLWGHVLLHGLAGATDSQEDEGVGQKDDGAGHDVAEDKEADDVAHSCRVLTGRMPVDAARCAIWLGPILPPTRQRTDSKHCSIAPDASDQQAGVAV